jgi:hypothetical protein
MAEEKNEEKRIYDGVGCPADKKSEKTIFRPDQQGDISVAREDGTPEKQRVIPRHATDHDKVRSDGVPVREAGDTECDQDGNILGPIIKREPPKTEPHPEEKEKESEKQSDSGLNGI